MRRIETLIGSITQLVNNPAKDVKKRDLPVNKDGVLLPHTIPDALRGPEKLKVLGKIWLKRAYGDWPAFAIREYNLVKSITIPEELALLREYLCLKLVMDDKTYFDQWDTDHIIHYAYNKIDDYVKGRIEKLKSDSGNKVNIDYYHTISNELEKMAIDLTRDHFRVMENNYLDPKYMLSLLSTNLDNHLKELSGLRSQHSLQ